jgi:hypothetical protein
MAQPEQQQPGSLIEPDNHTCFKLFDGESGYVDILLLLYTFLSWSDCLSLVTVGKGASQDVQGDIVCLERHKYSETLCSLSDYHALARRLSLFRLPVLNLELCPRPTDGNILALDLYGPSSDVLCVEMKVNIRIEGKRFKGVDQLIIIPPRGVLCLTITVTVNYQLKCLQLVHEPGATFSDLNVIVIFRGTHEQRMGRCPMSSKNVEFIGLGCVANLGKVQVRLVEERSIFSYAVQSPVDVHEEPLPSVVFHSSTKLLTSFVVAAVSSYNMFVEEDIHTANNSPSRDELIVADHNSSYHWHDTECMKYRFCK